MGEKGFLNNEQERYLAKIVDNAIEANGLLELFDGYFAKVAITLIDDYGLEKINVPEDVKGKLSELIDSALVEDVEKSEEIASEIINSLVDIPGLDEATEGMLFKGAIEIVVGAIIKKIRKE